MTKHEAGSNNGYIFLINQSSANGVANKATFVGSQAVGVAPSSTTSVNDGEWHQIAAVHVEGGNNLLYVDGAPAEASIASAAIVANTAPFLLGGFNQSGSATSSYTGLIDELQIYDQALTDGQIDFLFDNPAQAVPEPTTAGLLGAAGLLGLLRRRRA